MHLQAIGLALRLHPWPRENGTISTAEHPATNLYCVEISGWDDNKAFFVENSELDWTEQSGKQVTLNHDLKQGAVVFVRLLQPISNDRSHTVAYEAELVARTDEGLRQFRLRQVWLGAKHNCSNKPRGLCGEVPKGNSGPKWW